MRSPVEQPMHEIHAEWNWENWKLGGEKTRVPEAEKCRKDPSTWDRVVQEKPEHSSPNNTERNEYSESLRYLAYVDDEDHDEEAENEHEDQQKHPVNVTAAQVLGKLCYDTVFHNIFYWNQCVRRSMKWHPAVLRYLWGLNVVFHRKQFWKTSES